MGEAGNKQIKIRQRETTHKATTPKLKERKETKFEIEKFKSFLSEETISEEKEVTTNTVPIKITQSQALQIATKAATKFFILRPQITGTKLQLKPVYVFKIRGAKKQLIGKKFVEFHILADAVNGRILKLTKGYFPTFNPAALLGLAQNEIAVLSLMKKEISVSEICARTGYSESSVRDIISKLEEKKLISSRKSGRINLYFIFAKVGIPDLRALGSEMPLAEKLKIKADIIEAKIPRKEFENFFKSLGGIVLEYHEIYYPVYVIRYLHGKKQEVISIDAVTGRPIKS
jgi:DNA-binding transcriptional ArsR family regulator